MRILVQKFGGTSVSTADKRAMAIGHVMDALQEGYAVVVVVSAMGRLGSPYATDSLLSLLPASRLSSARELDLLMSCGELISSIVFAAELRERGVEASMLTGGQAGIVTDEAFSQAQILTIDTSRIMEELEQGRVVVVAGFQGRTPSHEVTTLGRGGSDTTATALGVALRAEVVDIYTDVEGIMTADPQIVEDAKIMDAVTYTDIYNLAFLGAKVIHPRSVEIAMHSGLPIRVRSTMSKQSGTLVSNHLPTDRLERKLGDRLVTGITQTGGLSQIQIALTSQPPDLQREIFRTMAEHRISVDCINLSSSLVAFAVSERDTDRAIDALLQLGLTPNIQRHCAKVSAVGGGISGVPGVMWRIVDAISSEGIEILQTSDSHSSICCLVHEKDMARAIRALHQQFELHLA